MKLKDFDYYLPKELIAQFPVKPRDSSRLLVLNGKTGKIEHRHFFDLPDYLRAGDVLVLNNSKVMKARLLGRKKLTGGKIEVFLLKKEKSILKNNETWQCLLGGSGRKEELAIEFNERLFGRVKKRHDNGTWEVEFSLAGGKFLREVEKIGHVPLPPYIKRNDAKKDIIAYQTIYADPKKSGSAAAPTAGLHFTPRLMKKLKAQGVQFEYVTLHVGLGTFAPVKEADPRTHKMHSEWVEIKKEAIQRIKKAKKEKRRIIAVGTTSVRSLEAVFDQMAKDKFGKSSKSFSGWVNIFIYPGYEFNIVDAMITNFHLPQSTLLILLAAFLENKAGKGRGLKTVKKIYVGAIKKGYRFFSYGDAMLIV